MIIGKLPVIAGYHANGRAQTADCGRRILKMSRDGLSAMSLFSEFYRRIVWETNDFNRAIRQVVTDRPCSCWHAGTSGNDRPGTGYVERRRRRTCCQPCRRTACCDAQSAWRSHGSRRSSTHRSASRKRGRRRPDSLHLHLTPPRLLLIVADVEDRQLMTTKLRMPDLLRVVAPGSRRHRTDSDSG